MSASDTTQAPLPDLIGLGVCTLDCVQPVPDFPRGDQVIHSRSARLMGGGPVATALVAASRLGVNSAMIDRTGDDWRGEQVRHEFEHDGVDTRWLSTSPDSTTAFANVMARESDGARAIVFASGSAAEFSPEDLAAVPFERAAVLHLNGRHWPVCLDAAERTRRGGGLVSFDGGAHRYRGELLELLARVDIAIVAHEFASHLAAEADTDAQLDHLLELGARVAGITDGVRGSWFATADGDRFHQPAFAVSPVVDTTGCGDAFHGAFLAAWMEQPNPRSAARQASAAAALNATGIGGRACLVDRAKLDAFLEARPEEGIASPPLSSSNPSAP